MNRHTPILGRISSAAARRPWPVIVIWAAVMLIAASLAGPKLWQVTTNDESHFLPNKYESVRATQFGQAHFGQLKDASAVTALVRRADGKTLTSTDRARSQAAVAHMAAWRPDWSTIKAPTAGERAARVIDPVVGPLAGAGSYQLVSFSSRATTRTLRSSRHSSNFGLTRSQRSKATV